MKNYTRTRWFRTTVFVPSLGSHVTVGVQANVEPSDEGWECDGIAKIWDLETGNDIDLKELSEGTLEDLRIEATNPAAWPLEEGFTHN